MSWLDVVIAAVVVVATERGLRVGVLRQVGGLVGFVTGFVVGILLAPSLASNLSGSTRPIVAILVVIACAVIGAVIGRQLGAAANLSIRRLKLTSFDRAGGAAFSAVGALVGCWLVAGVLVNVSFLSLSSAIEHSRLLAVMDRVMPPVPSVEAKVQALFRRADFPSVFAQLVAPSVPTLNVPSSSAVHGAVGASASSVFKITASAGCGVNREGTAFVVAPGVLATAAHVVAGAHEIRVNSHAARLVYLDVRNDVAFVAVSLGVRTISLQQETPVTAAVGAVVGYPLNGALTISPAAIDGTLHAQGRDIYNNALFVRDLLVLSATVQPGNSGSPVLVGARAVAMVFSRSTSQSTVAYAVPASVIAHDLARVRSSVTVAPGACPAA